MNNYEKFESHAAVKKLIKSVEKRLDERIVGLNLLPAGTEGAKEYMRRFGRGISAAKCAALAVVCARRADRNEGLCGMNEIDTRKNLIDFANQFERETERMGGVA
jgi:hypothetical protein